MKTTNTALENLILAMVPAGVEVLEADIFTALVSWEARDVRDAMDGLWADAVLIYGVLPGRGGSVRRLRA